MNLPTFSIQADDTQYGMVLPHYERDYIQGMLADKRKPYELQMLEAMAGLLSPSDLVLDVGANIGNHTMYLASIVKCAVYAFEPNPELCDALASSISLNNLDEAVKLYRVGVGSKAGKAHFDEESLNPDNIGAQSLALDDSDSQDSFDIITLDSLSIEQPVRMIKVDVEGMELDVLKGAKQLLERDKPILFVEAQAESDFESLNELLDDKGYVYWDTYNATPTHCFMHESELENQSYRDHMHHLGRKVYQLRYELQSSRKKVNDTGLKYRKALEQIEALKRNLGDQAFGQVSNNKEIVARTADSVAPQTKKFIRQFILPGQSRVSGDQALIEQLGFSYSESSNIGIVDVRGVLSGKTKSLNIIKTTLARMGNNAKVVMLSNNLERMINSVEQLDSTFCAELVSKKYNVAVFRKG